jgi:hypothetical protein
VLWRPPHLCPLDAGTKAHVFADGVPRGVEAAQFKLSVRSKFMVAPREALGCGISDWLRHVRFLECWSWVSGLQRCCCGVRAAQSAMLLRLCFQIGVWRADWDGCRHFWEAEMSTDSRGSQRQSLDPWRASRGAERPRPTGKFVSRTAAVHRGNGRGGDTDLPSELSSKFMDVTPR